MKNNDEYMGCNISKNTEPHKVKYSTYCKDTFLHADTKQGIKQLIKEYLKK